MNCFQHWSELLLLRKRIKTVKDSLNELFMPFIEVWQWQPQNKQDSKRLKFSEISTRYPDAPHDCIAMWIADMDIVPSKDVLEGIAEQVIQCTGYQTDGAYHIKQRLILKSTR